MPSEPAPEVAAVLATYPDDARARMLELRRLILQTAAAIPEVGPLTETLKWGEPSYLTEKSRSGTTVRIAWKAAAPERYALYVHCQTNLVDTFRTRFPELDYDGNRAVVFDVNAELPEAAVTECISMALTYHLDKRAAKRRA